MIYWFPTVQSTIIGVMTYFQFMLSRYEDETWFVQNWHLYFIVDEQKWRSKLICIDIIAINHLCYVIDRNHHLEYSNSFVIFFVIIHVKRQVGKSMTSNGYFIIEIRRFNRREKTRQKCNSTEKRPSTRYPTYKNKTCMWDAYSDWPEQNELP